MSDSFTSGAGNSYKEDPDEALDSYAQSNPGPIRAMVDDSREGSDRQSRGDVAVDMDFGPFYLSDEGPDGFPTNASCGSATSQQGQGIDVLPPFEAPGERF